jgi:hypothetical protein
MLIFADFIFLLGILWNRCFYCKEKEKVEVQFQRWKTLQLSVNFFSWFIYFSAKFPILFLNLPEKKELNKFIYFEFQKLLMLPTKDEVKNDFARFSIDIN